MKKSKKPIEQQSPLEQEISSQPAAEVQAIVDAQPTVDSGVVEGAQPTVSEAADTLAQQPTADDTPVVETATAENVQSENSAVSEENAQTSSSSEQPVDSEQIESQPVLDEAPADVDTDSKKKKKRERAQTDKVKKEPKVGLYIVSLFKYFNIITILPLALMMYAVFFSSYVVDKGNLFEKNVVWICVIMGVAAAIMIAWFIDTLKKRRVCSLDAFLLMALLICAGMILQCIIFKNFNSFDGIAIAALGATVAVLALLSVRLILFKPSEQRKNDDKKYKAKSKIGMYFRVIFAKYGFFISMLCVIGALLILIITQSNIFENFEFEATKTEKVVTMLFAAVAAVLMVVGIFIRIVRGRANVIDCMPYMFFIVGVGGLLYFIMKHTYMVLYVAIGATVVGTVWLILCQYTLLMSNYQKDEAESVAEAAVETGDGAAADMQTDATAETSSVNDTAVDNTATAEQTEEGASTADNTDAAGNTAVESAEASAAPSDGASVAANDVAVDNNAVSEDKK